MSEPAEERGWELDLCTCGFGGGDWTDTYASEAEARAAMASYRYGTNASVRAARTPSGELWGGWSRGLWELPPTDDSQ